MSASTRNASITLDLENDWYFEEDGYDHLTFEYIDEYIHLINNLDLPVTIFVVGKTLERFPEAIEKLQQETDSEFFLHSYQHDIEKRYDFEEELAHGKRAFRSFFGTDPVGYRAPQGNIEQNELQLLEREGFKFDSSHFPSYRPGIYNNLDIPLQPYRPTGATKMIELPIAAVPRFRIPITQSYLKLLGRPYLKYIKHASLPETLVFDSHLQDFYRTASHGNLEQPLRSIHNRNLDRSIAIFRQFISLLRRKGYSFVKLSDVYEAARNSA